MEKHPLPVRLSHWLNVPVLLLLIWSGILIYWAYQPYVRLPKPIVDAWGLHHRLGEGMGWHFFLMWIFAVNGVFYVSYLLYSKGWVEVVPTRDSLRDFFPTLLSELKLSKHTPTRTGKFNAVQRVAYTTAILMGLGSLVTGLAIYKPVQLGWLTTMLGGYQAARLEHFLLMVGFIVFIFIHLIQVARAGWKNLQAMIAGFELDHEP